MAVGLILFWPALFAIDGDEHKSEIARLKGEYDAIERAGIEKNCSKMKEDLSRVDRQKKLYQEDKEKSKKVIDELETLFNLYKAGAISEEEYNSMKKKVLNLDQLGSETNSETSQPVIDPDIIARDGQYVKYRNGIVFDSETGLEWLAGSETTRLYDGARHWVTQLDLDGGGWRLPSNEELKSLYQSGAGKRNMTILIETEAWHIFSRDSSQSYWKGFDFKTSQPFAFQDSHNGYDPSDRTGLEFRAFAVRSRR